MTRDELNAMRNEFWNTIPIYGGRQEIWDALRQATESELHIAQSIFDSHGIVLHCPDMTICLDNKGARYELPFQTFFRTVRLDIIANCHILKVLEEDQAQDKLVIYRNSISCIRYNQLIRKDLLQSFTTMGCACAKPSRTSEDRPQTTRIRKPAAWSHTEAITRVQLNALREEFWDTAPHYGGKQDSAAALSASQISVNH
nr:hypothetical protein [Tanacetum cinerariifolium]